MMGAREPQGPGPAQPAGRLLSRQAACSGSNSHGYDRRRPVTATLAICNVSGNGHHRRECDGPAGPGRFEDNRLLGVRFQEPALCFGASSLFVEHK